MAGKKVKSKGKDRYIFRKTADRTKKMNVRPLLFRGGIRL